MGCHLHAWDGAIHQVSGRLCHAPGAEGRTKSAPLTGEGHEKLVGAVYIAKTQKTTGQDVFFGIRIQEGTVYRTRLHN
jgi:hypothetical protein